MIPDANSVMYRATTRQKSGRWDSPSRDIRVFVDGLSRLGYEAGRLLISAGIDHRTLDDPDALIPSEAIGSFFSRVQAERFTPNLGLKLAQVTPIGSFPLLDYLILTSDTVGAGVHQLARYFRITGSPLVVVLEDDRAPIRVRLTGESQAFSVEYFFALMVLHFRKETVGRFAADTVSFQHEPDDVVEFERILGCRLQTADRWNGIILPVDTWRLQLPRRDPVLRQFLENQAKAILSRLPVRPGVASVVQKAIAMRVGSGSTHIGAIARELALSVRTLQRRLTSEGVSYQAVLDDARQQAAARYIQDSRLAICEIAYLLGYSEPAAFHRAFKRWYGVTPEMFRNKQPQGR
jgi:AraC-like DNA-binding protein